MDERVRRQIEAYLAAEVANAAHRRLVEAADRQFYEAIHRPTPARPCDEHDGQTVEMIRQVRETFFSSRDARTEDASSLTASEVASRIACMQAWFRSACPAPTVAPTAIPLSGSGYYGQACPREIPDTPFAEWEAGVEALLAACEQWQAQTDEVLHDPA